MKLAVSNIAWPIDLEPAVADLFCEEGVTGVEVAPSKVHPRPLEASPDDLRRYRDFWESRGIHIVAMQALLFGRGDLKVFGTPAERTELLDYLDGIYRVAAGLGATALVFGSPKNRLRGDLPLDQAWSSAIEFFREAGRRANDRGVWLCLEHNPAAYGCDFVTTADDARRLVVDVDTPGFGLHLDTGGFTLNSESTDVMTAPGTAAWWKHFHVSDPNLDPVGHEAGRELGRHAEYGQALLASGYPGWISIEMKTLPAGTELDRLREAIRFTRQHYAL